MSVQGTVKFFNAEKGYGFITPDQGYEGVFVHMSNVNGECKSLRAFQPVKYDPQFCPFRGGYFAYNVSIDPNYATANSREGIVQFFNVQRGFGFITPYGGSDSVFFHVSNINGDNLALEVGRDVHYYLQFDPAKGKYFADNVVEYVEREYPHRDTDDDLYSLLSGGSRFR